MPGMQNTILRYEVQVTATVKAFNKLYNRDLFESNLSINIKEILASLTFKQCVLRNPKMSWNLVYGEH